MFFSQNQLKRLICISYLYNCSLNMSKRTKTANIKAECSGTKPKVIKEEVNNFINILIYNFTSFSVLYRRLQFHFHQKLHVIVRKLNSSMKKVNPNLNELSQLSKRYQNLNHHYGAKLLKIFVLCVKSTRLPWTQWDAINVPTIKPMTRLSGIIVSYR